MFGITKTRTAIFFGACGLIVVCILFEEDPSTKCTKPLPIPVSDSPKKYFAWPPPIRKIPKGEKFPWEKMKDTERERPSEVEERKFIWEHVRPLTAKLPQRVPPMKLKGLQPGASGEEVVWALATQNSYDARQMPDAYVEDEHYFYVWCKGFSQIGEIINKNTYECSAWTTEKGSPRLFIE